MKKAFSLIELIVVITILAILWTIAFISLQGYVDEDKKYIKIETDYKTYYTEDYYEIDDCVEFTRIITNDEIKVCWTYIIIDKK